MQSFWQHSGLGKIEKIELTDSFRYTPQIANFLKNIEKQFPGVELGEDWGSTIGAVHNNAGPTPSLYVHKTFANLHSSVISKAIREKNQDQKKSVAILSVSNELFEKHTSNPLIQDECIILSSRDSSSSMALNKKKCIFSMPEFVAGLQFDSVYIVDVNDAETIVGAYSISSNRKFASQVYLGASRAKHDLEIHACDEYGGASHILSIATQTKSLQKK